MAPGAGCGLPIVFARAWNCRRRSTGAMGPRTSPTASFHCRGSASAGRTSVAACRDQCTLPNSAASPSPLGNLPGHKIEAAKRAARWFEGLGILLCSTPYWVARPRRPIGSDVGLGTLRHAAALLGRPLTLQPMSSHRSSQYLQASTVFSARPWGPPASRRLRTHGFSAPGSGRGAVWF